MAQFQLAQIIILDPVDGAFAANDIVRVFWDTSTEEVVVTLNGGAFTTPSNLGQPPTQVSGGNYQVMAGVTSEEDGDYVSGYSFCDGDDLVWFSMVSYFPQYPFFGKQITEDSPVCAAGGGAVCDIHWVGSPIITHATSQTEGGSIQLTAESSNGTVRYSLRKPSKYSDTSNETGLIINLPPGNWTAYAIDPNNCIASKVFTILYKPTGNEHYRFTWASKQIGKGTSRDARVRIYEREYIGDLVEIDYADVSPFNLMKPKQGDVNDKFYPIHPTNAILRLKSETNYQFLPLFTQDNKKFRVVYEVDEGSGFVEIWQGFIVPSVYSENFIATPYTVEIRMADNVKALENEPFTDDSNNLLFGDLKIIKVIALIMKKTGLSLKIRCGINIFETNHNTAATDDPFDQTYVDVSCYRDKDGPFNCWRVLESILRPFGARIFLYDNQWIIEEIDRAIDEYAYRVFDVDGDYESNSTFDPIIDVKNPALTDRAALIERDHSLEVIPAYGKIDIVSKLNYVGSIVAGGFEKEDLLSPESESFDLRQGIFTSEEGFRDWTLRLNGVEGVSFGRVRVGTRGDASRLGLQEEDAVRSVGAFFYEQGSWSGNLRNAYIESSEKPYQYGPGDELVLKFEYSTPAKPEYEFMVLRMMVKVGSNYLQNDLTWDTTENIYRSYPRVSRSLQGFELSVAVPSTDVVVDTTIQVRVYFYASDFYDYGLPPVDDTASNGTSGLTALRALATTGIDYDYNLEWRHQFTIGGLFDVYNRVFSRMVYSTAADDPTGAVVRPNDFDENTNPKVWENTTRLSENNPTAGRRRGLDRKFYVDNITLDALINGQPPPEEDTISFTVSKYINETLSLELYNFDVPNITNAKNMYNNYFRLSDGTPTSTWARSGISEGDTLQRLLLKVLGGNHSAPTFRVTGSFINEFSRIGINNYLRITKEGSSLSASNTEFTSNLTGWVQTSSGGTWAWTADNDGSAEVTLSGATNSKQIYQLITHQGGYIDVEVQVNATPTGTPSREDALWLLFFRGSALVHTEKLHTFSQLTSATSRQISHRAFVPGSVTAIGFVIQNVSGSGEVEYQVSQFAPSGVTVTEIYQITDYQGEERMNTYYFELMQLSKTYISLEGIDTGGTGQNGDGTGRAHSSAYSSAYA